jgi:hypothetical protein
MVDKIDNAIVVRAKVEPKKDYREYREELRFDFWYSCAYCTMTELESRGIGFDIDHYYPRKTHPQLINEYENLMWSCQRCNRCKSDFSPDEEDILVGNVIIRPDRDDPREHYELRQCFLEGKTPTGNFNIEWLDLNRQQLRRLREIRERFWKASGYIAFGIYNLIAFRIDKIRREHRLKFIKLRDRVFKRNQDLQEAIDSFIRESARSPLLDEDPEKKDRLKKRQEFLKDSKAILPKP